VFASPDDARQLLWRLHQFNLTYGLFAYGALFIPVLSYCNYLAQKRAIARYLKFGGGKFHFRLMAGVESLAAFLKSKPEAEDADIVRHLVGSGLLERDAIGLVRFVPIAFTRFVYRSAGVQFHPLYAILGPDQKPRAGGVIAEVPACRAAWTYCLNLDEERDLIPIAARSGGFKAIQELVESGKDLGSIEIGPPVIVE
jgi:hypothetical protein